MQEQASFKIDNLVEFKQRLICWANQFSIFLVLDGNGAKDQYSQFDAVYAVDATKSIVLTNANNHFDQFKVFQAEAKSTVYGYFSYDLKNELENLKSENPSYPSLPTMFFFEARYLIEIKEGKCIINRSTLEAMYIFDQINQTEIPVQEKQSLPALKSRVDKVTYLSNVEAIRKDIEEGTVYELNYCRELYAEQVNFDAIQAFMAINENAGAPFTAFLKRDEQFVLSFSPERFMQLKKDKLISQPIKGTLKKGNTEAENKLLKKQLLADEKERAENVMIVDLVRNDFARSAEVGSVKVDELFGIYAFKNILQMISTVSATKRKDVHFLEALKNAYPMGSMTGTPKIKAMELIEKYENTKRGLYSGAIGYVAPNGNFDFNVVIRTLIYDKAAGYLSLHVGGAITYDSIPEKEWEETELKAQSILQFLG